MRSPANIEARLRLLTWAVILLAVLVLLLIAALAILIAMIVGLEEVVGITLTSGLWLFFILGAIQLFLMVCRYRERQLEAGQGNNR